MPAHDFFRHSFALGTIVSILGAVPHLELPSCRCDLVGHTMRDTRSIRAGPEGTAHKVHRCHALPKAQGHWTERGTEAPCEPSPKRSHRAYVSWPAMLKGGVYREAKATKEIKAGGRPQELGRLPNRGWHGRARRDPPLPTSCPGRRCTRPAHRGPCERGAAVTEKLFHMETLA